MAHTILSEMADLDACTARIFASTYGISLTDAMRASYYARRRGSERCARALLLVEMSGCSFLTAAQAIEDADAAQFYTAPLNGREPALRQAQDGTMTRFVASCLPDDPCAAHDPCPAHRAMAEVS